MLKKCSFLFVLIIFLYGCDYNYFLPPRPGDNDYIVSDIDLLFEQTTTIRLKQVHAKYSINGIRKSDLMFNNYRTKSSISYFTLTNTNIEVFKEIHLNELWEFKKPVHGYYYREYSVGGNNELARDKYKTKYHPLERFNQTGNYNYEIVYIEDKNIYANFKPKMSVYFENGGDTNLKFETIVKTGNKLILKTNNINQLTTNVFKPLTSDEVKKAIAIGEYELYLKDGVTYFLIDNNFYLSRYNSYVHSGSIFGFGGINSLTTLFYEFEFEII